MNNITEKYLSNLSLGESQVYGHLTIVPIFAPSNDELEYITLIEGLKKETLTITEVDDSGNVPNLKVINSGDQPVLLLDGEDLAGAKQNRTLNTSILIRSQSETIIPVSCTEQGRWSYETHKFYDSDLVMSKDIRARKMSYVSDSLKADHGYRSDQGKIWDDLAFEAQKAGVHSRTGAMRDVYKSKSDEINEYLNVFKCKANQRGVVALLKGRVAGFDILSRSDAYALVHTKLVKSYCMDAIIDKCSSDYEIDTRNARLFLDKILRSEEKKFKSIGHGWDYRFNGNGVVGSALLYGTVPAHLAFFNVDDGDHIEDMSELSNRRGYRF